MSSEERILFLFLISLTSQFKIITAEVIEHHLAVCPHAWPVKQKVRKQAVERQEFITEEIKKLEALQARHRMKDATNITLPSSNYVAFQQIRSSTC